MLYKIQTMNKISQQGLGLFGAKYDVSDAHENADAIVVRSAKIDTDLFPSVVAVARAGAGTNNITTDKASAKGICVFNTPGANANAVAELVFTALGMAARNVHTSLEYLATLKDMTDDKVMDVEVEKQKARFAGWEVAGKTMGVVGLGKIGVLVANAAIARGMKVVAYEPFPNISNMHQLHHSVQYTDQLNDVISASQVISVHVPLLDATKGLINKTTLASFAKEGVVLNFSRGPVVNTAEIMEMLDAGTLAQYVCDFPTRALLDHSKVICLPHLGASTAEAEENCATMAVEQIKDYLEYGIVRNSVNFPAIEGRPAMGTKTRLIVINQDVPQMISAISKIIGDAGINIHSYKNESNGKIGYNMIDLETEIEATVVKSIEAAQNVIKVRVIKF
jgi:D-3-phosphoglycerate dehydrogenase / 2-oxoglutarate reductase